MLVLDTNMLSEIMRPAPDRKIADWIVRQPSDELFTAAVCQAEILSGLAVMPSGNDNEFRPICADEFWPTLRSMMALAQPWGRTAR
jgi:predicted nucleic acid-binding protein